MKGIIPTGGRGTRLQPLTFSTNKHFIPVGNKPLIFYPIEAVADAGIKEVLITYNPGWLDSVKKFLGTGSKWGLKITYVLQEEPRGLANIVEVCESALKGDLFVLHLGDNIFTEGIKEQVDYFTKNKPNGLVTRIKHPENWRLGVPYFKGKKLIKYVEKPKNPPNDYGIPGLYFFDNEVFKCFSGPGKIKPSARGELEIGSPYNWLVKHKYDVRVVEYKGKWLDPGKFDDWIESNQYLLDRNVDGKIEGKVDKNSEIEGRVEIGKGSRIVRSEIRGPVSIGNDVVISNSYVGPFTSINNNCVIKNSQVENSVLMEGVEVVDVSRLIDTSLIGTGAQVSNGNGGLRDSVRLFVGEKSEIKV